MKTKAQAREETRTKLLDAAMGVIRAKGYAATSVEDICQAAGVTKGSFFHYFKSKEELAVAAAEHFAQMADSLFSQASYQQEADPLQRLLAYIDFRGAIMHAADLPNITCLLGTMVQETYGSNPAIREACDQYISAHAKQVAADIQKAKTQYVPEVSWDPESLGYFTQAVIQGALILAKAKQNPQIGTECVAHLHRYVEMLFTPSPGHSSNSLQ